MLKLENIGHANISSPPEIKMRVKRNKLNTELYKTTIADTINRISDENTIGKY